MKKLLILGGTKDASDLANEMLKYTSLRTTYSLAGKTKKPHLPMCDVRIGGFGGVNGFINYLKENKIDLVIDATHPFAESIAANAAKACALIGTSHLKFNRPAWSSRGKNWIVVKSLFFAAQSFDKMGKRIFLSTGAKGLENFSNFKDKWFLIRLIEKPDSMPLIDNYKLILERGPFDLKHEKHILSKFGIDVLVTKNSGGSFPSKLLAANELNVPVIMINRPAMPAEIEKVATIKHSIQWIEKHL